MKLPGDLYLFSNKVVFCWFKQISVSCLLLIVLIKYYSLIWIFLQDILPIYFRVFHGIFFSFIHEFGCQEIKASTRKPEVIWPWIFPANVFLRIYIKITFNNILECVFFLLVLQAYIFLTTGDWPNKLMKAQKLKYCKGEQTNIRGKQTQMYLWSKKYRQRH